MPRKKSRSPHGERGLKFPADDVAAVIPCRSPHGERGLKLMTIDAILKSKGRSPHGERGLKCPLARIQPDISRRSPHGERGLKCSALVTSSCNTGSLSSRRAWIEMRMHLVLAMELLVALLTESVD